MSDIMAAAASGDLHPLKRSSSLELPPYMSELRVVLLGNSWSQRSSVGNFILGETAFNNEEEPDCCLRIGGQLKEKNLVIINLPDLLHPNISEGKLTEHVKTCMRLSTPGPHVFLLVLQPEYFTEEHKQRLCRVLKKFSDQSFDHSLVLTSSSREESSEAKHPPLKDLIRMCRYRHLKLKNLEVSELLTRLGQIVKENSGEHVSCDVFEGKDGGLVMPRRTQSEHNRPVLNLVLCGRRRSGKTSAAKAILGQTELHSVSKGQGEVFGCWVSLVELPALYGKPQKTVMKESFSCISFCEPEGIHAFILVLPVSPLTDEDKGELETIQNTFSSRVNDFIIILFLVETDPEASDAVKIVSENKDIRELLRSCGGRYVVLNIKDNQQISELFDNVDEMTAEGSRCFTKDTLIKGQMEKVVELKAELQDKKWSEIGGDAENQRREALRMVLIGQKGSGKRATANTILGKRNFKPRLNPKPVAKFCESAAGEADGCPVTVVITPELFEKTLTEDEIQEELQKCFRMVSPGPHVLLLVLPIGHFTQEDLASVELIKKYFGKKSKDFIFTIFTRGEDLDGQSFESYIEGCDGFIKQFIEDSGGRYQVFSNKDDTNRGQVKDLLTKIKTMVTENGGFYNTEILENMEKSKEIQLNKTLKDLTEEMKRKEDELKRTQEELRTLRSKEESTQIQLNKTLKDLAEDMKRKDDELKRTQEEFQTLRAKEESKEIQLNKTLKDLTEDMKRKEDELKRTQEELRTLRSKEESTQIQLNKTLKDLAEDMKRKDDELKRTQEEFQTLRAKEESKDIQLNKTLKDLAEDMKRTQEEFQTLRAKEESKDIQLNKTLKDLAEDMKRTQEEFQTLRAKEESKDIQLNKTLKDLTEDMKRKDDELKRTQEELRTLRAKEMKDKEESTQIQLTQKTLKDMAEEMKRKEDEFKRTQEELKAVKEKQLKDEEERKKEQEEKGRKRKPRKAFWKK